MQQTQSAWSVALRPRSSNRIHPVLLTWSEQFQARGWVKRYADFFIVGTANALPTTADVTKAIATELPKDFKEISGFHLASKCTIHSEPKHILLLLESISLRNILNRLDVSDPYKVNFMVLAAATQQKVFEQHELLIIQQIIAASELPFHTNRWDLLFFHQDDPYQAVIFDLEGLIQKAVHDVSQQMAVDEAQKLREKEL